MSRSSRLTSTPEAFRRYETKCHDRDNIYALTGFGFSMIAMGVNAVLAIAMTAAGTALFRVPVLAVNAVIAITMTGLIRMIAGVLGPAPRRTYPTRSRPNGRVVIRVEIAGRQSDARDMLTSVSRELIGRPNSCTTYNLRIVRFGNAKKTG